MAKNDVKVKVVGPSKGLVTRVPSMKLDPRVIVEARNVRAERGVLKNAPGYERIIPSPRNLDSPANLIFQANILNSNDEVRTTPIIGTSSKLYTVTRRARALTCSSGSGGGGGGQVCSLEVGFVGDTGRVSSDYEAVANMVKAWTPDIVIHLGDMVYADGVVDSDVPDFDEVIGQYWYEYIGGYSGVYGIGPALQNNKFFPVLGNHDWDDGVITEFYDFFNHAENPNKRYYHFKRGPCHFIVLSGYTAEEPDGVVLGSDQQEWAEAVVAASDCPFIFVCVHFPLYTSDVNNSPGQTNLRDWPLMQEVSAVISGHSHNMEVVRTNGITQITTGNGGHSLRNFTTPVTGSEYRYNSDYGAIRLNATSEEAVFRFYDKSGTVLHTETLEPRDSEDVSGICYIGDVGKEVFTLEIRPDEASAEVGSSWPFRCFANYQDGTTEDVTESSTWTSSDDTIAALNAHGVATALSPGEITVTAEYQEQTDTATFTALFDCIGADTDICFTIARNASMGTASGGTTRLEAVKEGIGLCLDNMDPEHDLAALVSFAGTYATQTEDATLDHILTDDFESIKDIAALMAPSGAKSIAEALTVARTELNGTRHREAATKVVILVVDGPANVTDPGGTTASESAAISAAQSAASTVASLIRNTDEALLVIVGYNVPAAYRSTVQALATAGYYYDVETADELRATMAALPYNFCLYGPGPYYVDPGCASAQLDYSAFQNWDVVRGVVDLVGLGSNGQAVWDVLPGNGLYVDLVGTKAENAPVTNTGTVGKLVSKIAYPFEVGQTYKLSFYMAGTNRGMYGVGDYSCRVKIGNSGEFLDELVEISDPTQPFTLYEFTFVAADDGSGKIIFDHQSLPAGQPTTVGLLLDVVTLENLTNPEVLLFDDFDNENPC